MIGCFADSPEDRIFYIHVGDLKKKKRDELFKILGREWEGSRCLVSLVVRPYINRQDEIPKTVLHTENVYVETDDLPF